FREPVTDFANDLLDLIQMDECCVPHCYLVKYGVLSAANASAHALAMFSQYDMTAGADYVLSNVREQKGRGGHNKKDYLLHPDAFELCLMRAKNTRKFARFYSLLRKVITGYDK